MDETSKQNCQENDLGFTFSGDSNCLYFKPEMGGVWWRLTESESPNMSILVPRKNLIQAVLAIKAGKLDKLLDLVDTEVYVENDNEFKVEGDRFSSGVLPYREGVSA